MTHIPPIPAHGFDHNIIHLLSSLESISSFPTPEILIGEILEKETRTNELMSLMKQGNEIGRN